MTAPVLMSNLAPCQGQVTSAPSTGPADSGPPRWVHGSLRRVERFSHPKEGDLLALHFDHLGLLVFQLIGRRHLHEFGHRPFLLWAVQSSTASSFSRFPGFASLSSSSCRA